MHKITLADLFILTALAAATMLVLAPAWRYDFSPVKFANALEYNTAAITMIVCTFGLVVFPVVLITAGILILRKTQLGLKMAFAAYLFLWAIISVPLAYLVARSCAGAIGH